MKQSGIVQRLLGLVNSPLVNPAFMNLRNTCRPIDIGNLLHTPIADSRFVVIDTETTGFHAYGGDEIVSIAMLETRGLECTGTVYSQLINPQRAIPAESSAIHGLHDADVRDAPTIEEVLTEVLDFIGTAVIVGHHIDFDLRFINRTLKKRMGCRLHNPAIDTMLLFHGYSGRLGHYTLDDVAGACKVEITDRHSALGDARATCEVFCKLAGVGLRDNASVGELLKLQSANEF
ncbi:MAG: 3'-5' exonuclease [Pseudomonadota bacterium]|nr:MAG: 3'-5' exonuclease [Pseudomonadota bacterium]